MKLVAEERAPFYLNVVYGMLLLRRGHEIEPLHEDLFRHVAPAQRARDPAYDLDAFAQDLAQLEAWGAVTRMAEALKIRSYKDNRRERFRYRLTEDAVALLEWLEDRLAARLAARVSDSRDRLADVLGHLRELGRVLDAWRRDERDPDAARRAYHLLASVDDAVHEITQELLGFRAAMLAFAARPYDLASLREILGALERYVGVYLARIEDLRREIRDRLAVLSQPRHRRALAECRDALVEELRGIPGGMRAASVRPADELIDAQLPFFAESGALATLCAKIDDSSREVLRKMYRYLRELERRSARVADLRDRLAEIAALPPEGTPALGEFVNRVVAAAHARFDPRTALANERRPPPLPRAQRAAAPRTRPAALRPKQASPEEARALRARRDAALRQWLETAVLGGAARARLSEARPGGEEAPRRWLDVARAATLGEGRGAARIGVVVEPADGRAQLGTDAVGLDAPDAWVTRADGKGERR